MKRRTKRNLPKAEHFPEAHMQFLKTYAAHANHPHAPAVCRLARDELEKMKGKAAV